MSFYHALIRTHHITSRKKVAALRQAAKKHDVHVVLCSGKPPGIMYVKGIEQKSVQTWVDTVQVKHECAVILHPTRTDQSQSLRYKDYKVAQKTIRADSGPDTAMDTAFEPGRLFEVESVRDFGNSMSKHRVYDWWRSAMGYANSKHDTGDP